MYTQDTDPAFVSAAAISSAATALEVAYSPVPFFRATYKPVPYMPRIPFATSWVSYFGFNPLLVQPPLPEGRGSEGELPGTQKWCSVMPLQKSWKCSLGWMDMQQNLDSEVGQNDGNDGSKDKQGREGEFENFWPGLGRWQLAIKMENADITFDHAEDMWETPRSNL